MSCYYLDGFFNNWVTFFLYCLHLYILYGTHLSNLVTYFTYVFNMILSATVSIDNTFLYVCNYANRTESSVCIITWSVPHTISIKVTKGQYISPSSHTKLRRHYIFHHCSLNTNALHKQPDSKQNA